MPPELIQILIQLPIVAVFVWYTDKKDRQFLDFLREQRESDRGVLRELLQEIKDLREDHLDHDKRVTEAITTMRERTQSYRKPLQ